MGEDFNYTAVLEDMVNNSMESTEQVSEDLLNESNALSGFLIFLFIMLLMVIVIAVIFGGIMRILKAN